MPEVGAGGKRTHEQMAEAGGGAAGAANAAAPAALAQAQSQTQPQGSPFHTRARLESRSTKEKGDDKVVGKEKKGKDRWRTHRVTEDYVNFVGDLMYPKTVFGPYGFDPAKGRFPFERVSTLGYLLNPMRRPLVVEKWNPHEVAVFEASITLFGKNFHQVSKFVKTKTCKECIEFYYFWKKTSHYKQYKKTFIYDERDIPDPEGVRA